jgi:amidase
MLADKQHPCGSSGGSAVAVAAGFAPVALGTETQGSISCPASFTALYGFKASTGLLSRTGILPASTTFDSAGVLAKSAWDVASVLSVLAGPDAEDAATLDAPYAFLPNLTRSWSDLRLGVADKRWFWEDRDQEEVSVSLTTPLIVQMSAGLEAVSVMAELGAVVVDDVPLPGADLSRTEVPRLMGRIIRRSSSRPRCAVDDGQDTR